jgi:ribonuclease HII
MQNPEYVLGIDEVGRGALSGPVYLGGVMLDKNYPLYTFTHEKAGFGNNFSEFKNIRDSKKLPAKTRQNIHDLILEKGIQNLVLSASNNLIDQYGIGVCLSHMTALIISILYPNTKLVVYIDGKIKLLDEFNLGLLQKLILENDLDINTKPYITKIDNSMSDIFGNTDKIEIIRENKADDKYLTIALASNLAKVKRDKFMSEIGKNYPEFDWQTNKGYGTEKHRLAIAKNSNNQYLRQTFLSRIVKIP